MGKIVEEFMNFQIMQDYESVANVEEFISKGSSLDASHGNVLGELLGQVISLIASNNSIEERLVNGDVHGASSMCWCIMCVCYCTSCKAAIRGCIRHA